MFNFPRNLVPPNLLNLFSPFEISVIYQLIIQGLCYFLLCGFLLGSLPNFPQPLCLSASLSHLGSEQVTCLSQTFADLPESFLKWLDVLLLLSGCFNNVKALAQLQVGAVIAV